MDRIKAVQTGSRRRQKHRTRNEKRTDNKPTGLAASQLTARQLHATISPDNFYYCKTMDKLFSNTLFIAWQKMTNINSLSHLYSKIELLENYVLSFRYYLIIFHGKQVSSK
jgi:hypothetical protein